MLEFYMFGAIVFFVGHILAKLWKREGIYVFDVIMFFAGGILWPGVLFCYALYLLIEHDLLDKQII